MRGKDKSANLKQLDEVQYFHYGYKKVKTDQSRTPRDIGTVADTSNADGNSLLSWGQSYLDSVVGMYKNKNQRREEPIDSSTEAADTSPESNGESSDARRRNVHLERINGSDFDMQARTKNSHYSLLSEWVFFDHLIAVDGY